MVLILVVIAVVIDDKNAHYYVVGWEESEPLHNPFAYLFSCCLKSFSIVMYID